MKIERKHGEKTLALRKTEMDFIVSFPKKGLPPELTDPLKKLKELNLMYLDRENPPMAHISHIGRVVRDLILKLWGAQKERKILQGEIALLKNEALARDFLIGTLRKELAAAKAEFAQNV